MKLNLESLTGGVALDRPEGGVDSCRAFAPFRMSSVISIFVFGSRMVIIFFARFSEDGFDIYERRDYYITTKKTHLA